MEKYHSKDVFIRGVCLYRTKLVTDYPKNEGSYKNEDDPKNEENSNVKTSPKMKTTPKVITSTLVANGQ